jgi:CRISPR system Cascade subunit CasE
MVQMWLQMPRLVELGRMLHLPLQHIDHNYITHCAMAELFGNKAPGPFSVEENNGKYLRVLAYSSSAAEDLQQRAQLKASPAVYEICDWDRLSAKPMPSALSGGTSLAFETRVCPVVRKSSDGKYHSAGTEVDAFLSRVWEVNDESVPIDREEVYQNWFARQLEQRGGARPLEVNLKRFSIERMLRRVQSKDRTAKTIKRPDVTLTGRLQVTDSDAFNELLKTGIGRHTSFGFGMLKVRP